MNYVHAALLLHSAKKEINEDSVTKVVEATGEKVENAQVKALVAALKDVNIEEAIKQSVVTAAAAPAAGHAAPEAKKDEKKEEKKAEEAAAGLSSLFG